MVSNTQSRLNVAFGQLAAGELNTGTNYGKIIVPGDETTNTQQTITCGTVLVNDYVVIDGLTFTAKASTTQSSREFNQASGDNAAATALALCINGVYGVPGVTATAASAVVTLTWGSTHPAPVVVTTSSSTLALTQATRTPGISATGRNQLTVVDAWIRAIGGTTAGCSAVELQTTAATPIVVVSWPVANIARDIVARPGVSNTVCANLLLDNAAGKGLKLAAITDMSGATAMDYCVYFTGGRGKTVRSEYRKITVAQAAAGYNLVPPDRDRQYTVLDAWVRSTGAMATANVTIGDGTTTVATFTQAGMTNLAVLRAGTVTTGVATNLLTKLAVNKPITILADATDGVATHLEVYVEYAVSRVTETA